MQKINFQNLPNTTTPINATNLNLLQDNIEDVFDSYETMGNLVKISLSVFISASDTNTLVNTITSNMADYGFYIFCGAWSNHSNGYMCFATKQQYSETVDGYMGLVIAHDGGVYTFSQRGNNTPTIKTITTN